MVTGGARRFRLITATRAEKGLWSSATCEQRLLMLAGALVLAFGSWVIGHNEDKFLRCQQELSQIGSSFVDVPCLLNGTLPAIPEASMAHLEGCQVVGPAFTPKTPGLEELRFFMGSLPANGVKGAWFKISLERYDGNAQEWVHAPAAGRLRSRVAVGDDVRIGGFRASREIARLIPGSVVPLHEAGNDSLSFPGVFSSSTMRLHNNHLYSGNPSTFADGDLKISFRIGDVDSVSVLAAVLGEQLRPWEPLEGRTVFATLPEVDAVMAGTVSGKTLANHLRHHAFLGFWHFWPMRCLGFIATWVGMSCLLFPNHIAGDFCGKYCCCRSLPGTLATAVVSAVGCWCYFLLPIVSTVLAVVLVPLLLATAAGVNLRRLARQLLRKKRSSSTSSSRPSGGHGHHHHHQDEIPYHVLQATGGGSHHHGTLERTTRIVALGVGMALVMAGPMVQSVALVSWLGDYWDAFDQ